MAYLTNGTCRGCGRPIFWIKTASGKSMPCDPEQVWYWQKPGGSKKIVTPYGEVVSAETEGDLENVTGIGHIPHFATCPRSSDFRRR